MYSRLLGSSLLALSILTAACCLTATAQAQPATGPLRVLESNPRYFTDGSGRAIYLAGSHNWWSFPDSGHQTTRTVDPPPVFDFEGYLDMLQKHNHNFIRLWRWEAPMWTGEKPDGARYSLPHPWRRTGPGMAKDGKPKFDLSQFDPAYFERLRGRVAEAGSRGVYVSVMLFEGFAAQFLGAWPYHPYQADNNINAIDSGALDYYTVQDTSMRRKIRGYQEAYVRKVIDTVNDLDNVLYEICNESGTFSHEWQYHQIRSVKAYEAGKPRQHPVGMTVAYANGINAAVFNSPADWISPNAGGSDESYRDEPSGAYRGKVIVNDTDHLWGHTGGDSVWVWKSFCRGLHALLMEQLTPSPTWQDSAREAMGQTVSFSRKVGLAGMTPQDALAETRYCLANPGKEYVVFQPGNKGEFWLSLKDAPGEFAAEWLNVTTGATIKGKAVTGGERRTFAAPFGGPAVLYLKRVK